MTTTSRTTRALFTVGQYHLEPMRLSVDTPRHVYYRGEEIEGTIRASYYYGAPLAGREIRYQLADDRQHTATTDAKGEVHFKLPTREFSETQVLTLQVSLPERNLQAAVNYMLSAEGFSIALSTVRPVFVAGETFETTLKTLDAEGKPTAEKLSLKVLEQTSVQGKVGERLVEEHPDRHRRRRHGPKDLEAGQGGRLRRPRRRDRPLQEPHQRRVRACRFPATRTKCGSASWPTRTPTRWATRRRSRSTGAEPPALGLVTFQGRRVLDYRLVELKTGVNELSDSHDRQAGAELRAFGGRDDGRGTRGTAGGLRKRDEVRARVQGRNRRIPNPDRPLPRGHQPLQRRSRPAGEDRRQAEGRGMGKRLAACRPGEEVEVAVTTTDPQGKPVAAEAEPGNDRAVAAGPLRGSISCRSRTISRRSGASRPCGPPPASPSPTIRPRSRSTAAAGRGRPAGPGRRGRGQPPDRAWSAWRWAARPSR